MSLRDLVAQGVALANQQTAALQVLVGLERWIEQDGLGNPVFGPREDIPALVEWKQRLVRTASGQEIVSTSKVTFIRPVVIDSADRLTLPDGTNPAMLAPEGLVDPEAAEPGTPYLTVVWCA